MIAEEISNCEFLKEHIPYIRLLCETRSTEQRQALLDTATPGQIRAISEIALNLAHGYGGCIDDPEVRKKVIQNYGFLKKVITEQRPFARKRTLLANTHQREATRGLVNTTNAGNKIQTGKGIFSFLLPAIGGLLNTVVGGLTGK